MSDKIWLPVDVEDATRLSVETVPCAADWCDAMIIVGDAVEDSGGGEMHWTCAKDWRVGEGIEPDYTPTREWMIAKWTIFDRVNDVTGQLDVTIPGIVDAIMAAPFFERDKSVQESVSFHLERQKNGSLKAVEDVAFPIGVKGQR